MPVKSQLDAKIYLALISRLKLMSGGYTIVEPHETYPTAADTAFLVVQDVRFDPTAPYVGGNSSNENTGQFVVSVMTPLSWTHAQILGIAGLIRDHMPKTAKYTESDVTVEITATPYYNGNSRRDDSFNRIDVVIGWRAAG